MRELYKLLLNALYGKLMQESGRLFNPFWASQITGHCRARLHQLEHQYCALHSSTDSILTQARNIATGGGLGELEINARGRLVLLRNKLFVLLDPEARVLKSSLHAFQGSADDLLALIRRGGGPYTVSHMVKPREALRRREKPFRWIEQHRHLEIPPGVFTSIAQALRELPSEVRRSDQVVEHGSCAVPPIFLPISKDGDVHAERGLVRSGHTTFAASIVPTQGGTPS
jgi:hypothetical protein